MRKELKMKKVLSIQLLVLIVLNLILSINTLAVETTENKYYLGEAVNTGKDNGYSKSHKIKEDDPHFGWKIGDFFVSGFTDSEKDENGDPVFLKNVGDKITLWFCLNQDINKLNGKKDLSIYSDSNGYDQYFGIEKTKFKKGALIIRKKGSDNLWEEPVIYTDYLKAHTSQGAYTEVALFEEGDYEVALNYEIKETNVNIFGWKPFPNYHNYRIFFRFSVRNGNCMVFPFDVSTGAELTNSAFTENGFYLDLANSKYLNINIKKEILKEGANGLVEDTRFNRPAKDREHFTEEGIYTITATNEYTNQQTTKKIYVGTNNVMKAHVTTGFSIDEINHQISLGATISENGSLIPLSSQAEISESPSVDSSVVTVKKVTREINPLYLCVVVILLVIIIISVIILKTKKNKKGENQ